MEWIPTSMRLQLERRAKACLTLRDLDWSFVQVAAYLVLVPAAACLVPVLAAAYLVLAPWQLKRLRAPVFPPGRQTLNPK